VKFACLIALLLAIATVIAQPIGGGMDSIEWQVADSDVVAAGQIKNLQTLKEDRNTHDLWLLVTFAVDETIKAPKHKELRFVLCHKTSYGHVRRWAQDRTNVMVFLGESRHITSRGSGYRLTGGNTWLYSREPFAPVEGYDENSMLELKSGAKVQAWTIDLRPLSEPEDILKEARKAAREEPKGKRPIQQMLIIWPEKLEGLQLDTRQFSGNFYVFVPVDARTERVAQGWVNSPEKELRRLAVDVLVSFKSQKNVVLLRKLLDDPATWNVHVPDGSKEDRHMIREAARFALECWGITP
jgi:hypothetical protein